ncbi:hypothetical protein ml_520 [Mollivirus sibericum]|uniref:hypothetical protein n=1 Tax=Mollivirus sibericum TaxID=1678078 RepID=UPI0006B2E095|nr:hypothetical protein ml_4 [Mollivirus sibericum]YP_009165486.1 hypothetical protein ml_520 [Mollivirus sibericum]ALD61806.1 hypothetical protein ml_4 [Mollivirus sibericum]ALD62322.1 hypothetical protein ml_520 [Mollivirus sibericum]
MDGQGQAKLLLSSPTNQPTNRPSTPWTTTKSWDGHGIIGGMDKAKPSCCRRLHPTVRTVDNHQILGWTDGTVGGDGWPRRPSRLHPQPSVPWTATKS